MNANHPSVGRVLLGAGLIALCLGANPAAAVSRGVRGTTRTNVSRPAGASNVNTNRNAGVNADNRAGGNIDLNRDANGNFNGNDINLNRNINVGVDPGYGRVEHPVAAAVAVTAAVAATAAVTAAVIGTYSYTLPPNCAPQIVYGVTYQVCGGDWYLAQYYGDEVQYAVVYPPI